MKSSGVWWAVWLHIVAARCTRPCLTAFALGMWGRGVHPLFRALQMRQSRVHDGIAGDPLLLVVR
jgi:hypothetical protein